MKRIFQIFSVVFLFCLLFTGCTSEDHKEPDNTQDQSGAPIIDYEMPDKANGYDFDIEFVPEG